MTYKQAKENSPRRIGVVSLLTRRMDEQAPLYNSDDLSIHEQSSMISDVVHLYSLQYKQISTVYMADVLIMASIPPALSIQYQYIMYISYRKRNKTNG